MINCPTYKQSSAPWGDDQMSPSRWTLAQQGCLTTCFAAASWNMALDMNPEQMNEAIIRNNVYTSAGEMYVPLMPKVLSNRMVYLDRVNTDKVPDAKQLMATSKIVEAVAVKRITNLIRYGTVVPIWVDAVSADGRPDHWVAGFDVNTEGKIIAMDPGYGDKIVLSDRYPVIYGFQFIVSQFMAVPDNGDSGLGVAASKIAQVLKRNPYGTQDYFDAYDALIGLLER